jgi:NAD(P)-dependent dehydrogenase (short-subunit alcohol dehydrogenase family)
MVPSMTRLASKCAVITGAGSGIGRAAALQFAREGASVVLCDLDAQAAEAVAAEAGGVGIGADVTSQTDMERVAQTALDTFGRIDALYANAGIAGGGSAHSLEQRDWDRVIAVNLTGVWLSMRAVLPAMIDAGSGSIITQASTGGLVGVPGIASYSAAKGGVIALTRQVAVEYGRNGIRANTICPGTVLTPLVEQTLSERGLDDAAMLDAARGYPLKRLGTVDEIASLALYLASDEAAWITGGTFTADGGYTAR